MPEHYALDDFAASRWDYRQGHHVAAFGPTGQAGKSTLLLSLLGRTDPDIAKTVLVMKHRDRVVSAWTRRLGFRETDHWPPERKLGEIEALGGHRPAGYTLWPKQSLVNTEADNAHLRREFMAALIHNRMHTPSITFADEIYGLLAELSEAQYGKPSMRTALTAVVTRDSIAGHGLWYASQKPSGTQGISIPGFFFNSAEHMFLSRDGEERNRRRYAEIACGIAEQSIERETLKLQPYSWLYIRRSGPQWAVIDAYDPALAV